MPGTALPNLPSFRVRASARRCALVHPLRGHGPRCGRTQAVRLAAEILVPPGTVVGISTWALHRKQEYHPRQFMDSREHWIANAIDHGLVEIAARAPSAFAAFGLGLRGGCIGENVAHKELSLALAWIAVGYMTYGQKLEIRPVRRKAGGRMRRSEYRLEDVWVWAGDEAQSKASMAVVGVTA